MTRTKRFLDGVFVSYANQILVMLVGLWLTPFLLTHLGQHDFGLWLIGLKALSYLTLLDIGILGLLPREVAFAKGRMANSGGTELVRTVIEETAVVILTSLPLLIAASFLAWRWLPSHNEVFRNSVALILIVFTVQFPFRIIYSSLEGLQDLGFLGTLQMIAWGAGLIVNVVMVLRGAGLYALALGWAITQGVITAGSIWRFYCRYPEFFPRRLRRLSWTQYRGYFGASIWVSITQVAQILRNSDLLLVGKVMGANMAVPFSCTGKLIAIGTNQPLVIMQSAQPALSELRATGDRKHLAMVIGSLTQAMLMLSGAVGVVVLVVNRGFVQRWVGADQYLGFWLTVSLLMEMMIRHWNVTTIYSLFSLGHQRHISIVSIADGVCTVLATWVLIAWIGPLGAPLGSLSAVVFLSLPWNLHKLRRELDCPLLDLLMPVKAWGARFLPVLLVLGILGELFLPANYFMIGLASILAAAFYALTQWGVVKNSRWVGHARAQLTLLKYRFLKSQPELVP